MARSTWLVGVLFVSAMVMCAAESDDYEDSYWDTWLDWSSCSLTCGTGYRVRSHFCIQDVTGNVTTDNCTGDTYEVATCKESECAVNGGWGNWLTWLDCSLSCGTGVRFRQRPCNNPVPAFNGSDCTGQNNDFETCSITACPVDGGWTNWGSVVACSQTCGIGSFKERERNCTNPEPQNGGKDCVGNSTTDIHPCDYVDCRDGIWEDWQPWEQCSQTCGASVQLRTRNCTFSVSNGSCAGNYFDFRPCNISCPVDGVWSTWLDWNTCSSSCENGTRIRGRLCANPAPAHGGNNCTGDNAETQPCFVSVLCPINGNWTSWQSWSTCDATCGSSHRVRLRECTNPAPKYNGICAGNQTEIEVCKTDMCPVDGGWTNWFPWGTCSVTCGTGSQSRLRLCSNPKPVAGGQYCDGDYEEVRNCSINPDVTNCTIDGDWSSWGSWGGCSVTCGSGTNNRNRTCTNPAPHGSGQPCIGNSMEYGDCTTNTACPIDGGWSSWVDWFPCSLTCGNGTQERLRTCTNPKPQLSGMFCIGDNIEDRDCNTNSCSTGSVAVIG